MGSWSSSDDVHQDGESVKELMRSQLESKERLLKEAAVYFDNQKYLLNRYPFINRNLHLSKEISERPASEIDLVPKSDLFPTNSIPIRKHQKYRSKLDPSLTFEETYQIGKLKYSGTGFQNVENPNSHFPLIDKFMTDKELLHSYLVDDRFSLDSNRDEFSVPDRLKLIWHFLAFRFRDFCSEEILSQSWDSTIKPDLETIFKQNDIPIHNINMFISPVQRVLDIVRRPLEDSVEVNAVEQDRNSEFDANHVYESILIDRPFQQSPHVPPILTIQPI